MLFFFNVKTQVLLIYLKNNVNMLNGHEGLEDMVFPKQIYLLQNKNKLIIRMQKF